MVRPELAPPLLTTVEHRVELFEQAGLDAVLVLPFTRERADQEAADFVRDVLVGRLHAAHVVVGRNFRFGHRAAGDVAAAASSSAPSWASRSPPWSWSCWMPGDARPAEVEAPCVSSTEIRAMVAAGDVEGARRRWDVRIGSAARW